MKIQKVIIIILLLIFLLIIFRKNISGLSNTFSNILYYDATGTLQTPGIITGNAEFKYGPSILFTYTNPSSTGDTSTNKYSIFNDDVNFTGFTSGQFFLNPQIVLFEIGKTLAGYTDVKLNNGTYTSFSNLHNNISGLYGSSTISINGTNRYNNLNLYNLYYLQRNYLINELLSEYSLASSNLLGNTTITNSDYYKYNAPYINNDNTFCVVRTNPSFTCYYTLPSGKLNDTFSVNGVNYNTNIYRSPLTISHYYIFGIALVSSTVIGNFSGSPIYTTGNFKYKILQLTNENVFSEISNAPSAAGVSGFDFGTMTL